MPKIRNVSDDTRTLRDGRTVPADGVIEVSDDEVAGFECQPRLWRVESSRKPAAKEGE